jgi:fructose-1,6-bisphosphatase I
VVNYKVNKAGLVDIVETLGSRTFKGRSAKAKLDVYANEILFKH